MLLKAFKYLLIIIFLLAFSFIGIILFVDKKEIINIVNKKIHSEFGKNINYDEKVELDFFPTPKIIIKNLKYYDLGSKLDLKIKELKLASSWSSIFNLEPEISNLYLFEPTLRFQKKKLTESRMILINNDIHPIEKFKKISKKFKKIIVDNGTLNLFFQNESHKFKNFNGIFNVDDNYDLKLTFYYENIKSNYDSKIFGSFLKGFKFQIDQRFLNNNALIYNGNISFEEKTFINGTINSSKLDLDEVLVILSKFQSLKKNNFILAKSSFNKDIEANFLVNIEEIFLKKKKLKSTNFKIHLADNTFLIKNFNSSYLNSKIKLKSEYNFILKKLNGKFNIKNLLINENFFDSKNEFKIKKALLNCSLYFIYDNTRKASLDNFSINNGRCKSDQVLISGIDTSKILSKLDNLNKFQDFFNLFNFKNFRGTTKLDKFLINFNLENQNFIFKNLEVTSDTLLVKSLGNYNLSNKDFNLQNNVSLSTKKFPNLPEFSVFLNGTIDNYEISYNLDKIKTALFQKGVDKLLDQKKKIIIDPKSLNKLLKEKTIEDLDPNKLFDLFLN